jgi:drug/metabolite transporter (DMT)-like permease
VAHPKNTPLLFFLYFPYNIRMQNIGFAYAVAAAVTWGIVYTIDQKILYGLSPIALLFFDSILTAVIMLPFLFFDKSAVTSIFETSKTNLILMLASVILAIIANFFIFSAIKTLNASDASIIEIAYPFFVALFSYFVFDASPNGYFFLGGSLIFIGSIVIMKFA